MSSNDQMSAAEQLASYRNEEYVTLLRNKQIQGQIADLQAELARNNDRLGLLRGVIEGAHLQMKVQEEILRQQNTPTVEQKPGPRVVEAYKADPEAKAELGPEAAKVA